MEYKGSTNPLSSFHCHHSRTRTDRCMLIYLILLFSLSTFVYDDHGSINMSEDVTYMNNSIKKKRKLEY